jgi:hypothetical protein
MPFVSSGGRKFARFAILLATTSLSLNTPFAALAQPAPPGATSGGDLAGQPDTNPPSVAGNLADIAGSVSFHAAGETQWSPATLNYPVSNGEGFWTEPQASATIDIADDRIVLDESTELDVAALDQSQFVTTEAQGAIFVQLNSVAQGQTFVVNTPRGSVQIAQAGEYEIVAGDTNDATTVTVVSGAAHVTGTNLALDIGPNQTATITGSDTLQGSVGAYQEDAFLRAQLRRAPQPQSQAAVPQQVRYMTGGAELAAYGSFSQSAQYGQVWYPNNVPSTWAPYRDGHWAYVQPWGWTWVDNARWGFAPFHYGRWAQIDNRWGWIPGGGGGEAAYAAGSYPVYSPALVAFIGVGAAGIGFAAGEFAAGGYAPAWVPLGFHEPYYPWYHCRADYFGRINRYYGVPNTIIERGPTYYNSVNFHQTNIFINRRAATVIPAAAFARGQPVQSFGRPLPERAFADARPLAGRLPVRPTAFTPNLPPEAARRFNIAAPARPVHVAAGPRILPVAQGVHAMPELRRAALPHDVHGVPAAASPAHPGEAGRPGLPPSQGREGGVPLRPGEARPGEVARPGEAERPGADHGAIGAPANHGLPELRKPGARPDAIAHPGEAATPGARSTAEARQRGPEPDHAARPPEAARPETPRPGAEARPGERPAVAPHGETARPGAARATAPRPDEHQAAPRPEAARPEPRQEAPHREVARPEVHAAPPREARPAPHAEAPHPAPHVEAPRPAPHAEAPHPAPSRPPHKEEPPHK